MVKWVWLLYILQGLKDNELPYVWTQLHGHIPGDGCNIPQKLQQKTNSVLYIGQCFLFKAIKWQQTFTGNVTPISHIIVEENLSRSFLSHLLFLWIILIKVTEMFGKTAFIFVVPFTYNALAVLFLFFGFFFCLANIYFLSPNHSPLEAFSKILSEPRNVF